MKSESFVEFFHFGMSSTKTFQDSSVVEFNSLRLPLHTKIMSAIVILFHKE